MVISLAEQVAIDRHDAELTRDRLIEERHKIDTRIAYAYGCIDAFRVVQKKIEAQLEAEAV